MHEPEIRLICFRWLNSSICHSGCRACRVILDASPIYLSKLTVTELGRCKDEIGLLGRIRVKLQSHVLHPALQTPSQQARGHSEQGVLNNG